MGSDQGRYRPLTPASALLVCPDCGAAVPMSQAQQTHLRWHARVTALTAFARRVADLEVQVAELEAAAKAEAGALERAIGEEAPGG